MPRFMFMANYTLEGLQGLLKEGGTGRKKAVETLVTSLGGRLDSTSAIATTVEVVATIVQRPATIHCLVTEGVTLATVMRL